MDKVRADGMLDKYRNVVCFVAHPDDCEICAYGTLARLKNIGAHITVVIATGGERGVEVTQMESDNAKLIANGVRRGEAENALSTIADIHWLKFIDGHIDVSGTNISVVDLTLKKYRPDLILTHPYKPPFDHQDHVAVSQLVQNSWQRLPNQCDLWLFEPIVSSRCSWSPNMLIEMSSHMDEKMNAMKEHKTQAGRIYLTRKWHEQRSHQNTNKICANALDTSKVYEAFEACITL